MKELSQIARLTRRLVVLRPIVGFLLIALATALIVASCAAILA